MTVFNFQKYGDGKGLGLIDSRFSNQTWTVNNGRLNPNTNDFARFTRHVTGRHTDFQAIQIQVGPIPNNNTGFRLGLNATSDAETVGYWGRFTGNTNYVSIYRNAVYQTDSSGTTNWDLDVGNHTFLFEHRSDGMLRLWYANLWVDDARRHGKMVFEWQDSSQVLGGDPGFWTYTVTQVQDMPIRSIRTFAEEPQEGLQLIHADVPGPEVNAMIETPSRRY